MYACYTAGWCGWGSHQWWTTPEFTCKRLETTPFKRTRVWLFVSCRRSRIAFKPTQMNYTRGLNTSGLGSTRLNKVGMIMTLKLQQKRKCMCSKCSNVGVYTSPLTQFKLRWTWTINIMLNKWLSLPTQTSDYTPNQDQDIANFPKTF